MPVTPPTAHTSVKAESIIGGIETFSSYMPVDMYSETGEGSAAGGVHLIPITADADSVICPTKSYGWKPVTASRTGTSVPTCSSMATRPADLLPLPAPMLASPEPDKVELRRRISAITDELTTLYKLVDVN